MQISSALRIARTERPAATININCINTIPGTTLSGLVEIFAFVPSEIEKLNIYACEMDMLRDRRNYTL
jgi:hypothetical protein